MLLFKLDHIVRVAKPLLWLMLAGFLTACQFEPLHGSRSPSGSVSQLNTVGVAPVDTRVGQQVRNHLLFLFNGGYSNGTITHEARLRISSQNNKLASVPGQDTTSGTVTVVVSYDLVDVSSGKILASGSRNAIASYDRTSQDYANTRALRDAENRAAKEAAEAVRLAIAADLNRTGA